MKSEKVVEIRQHIEEKEKITNLNERKPNKKEKKSKKSLDLITLSIIGILIWIGISTSFAFIEQQMEISLLKERKQNLELQIKKEEKELKKVKVTLSKMDTIEFIEKQAREKLGMIKPGETVYIDLIKKKN